VPRLQVLRPTAEYVRCLLTPPPPPPARPCCRCLPHRVFHLDEYVGLDEAHPASFVGYLKKRFLDRVEPKPKIMHGLRGTTPEALLEVLSLPSHTHYPRVLESCRVWPHAPCCVPFYRSLQASLVPVNSFFRLSLFLCVSLIFECHTPQAECSRYAALLNAAPIDICACGIGENGHLAFNDPPVCDFFDPLTVKVHKGSPLSYL